MNYNYIFPTCVFSDNQIDLAKEILPVCEEYLNKYGDIFGMNENHISTYRNTDINPEFKKDTRVSPLIEYLIENSLKFLSHQNVNPTQFEKSIRDHHMVLINKITKGGSHVKHAHPKSLISGCFYLKCSEDPSPIIFSDPRDYYKYIQYDQLYNAENYSCLYPDFFIPVKQGLCLMWPSWLEHEVPFSTDDSERISIAFNLGLIS